MNPLLFLTTADFELRDEPSVGRLLCTRLPGISLLFFFTPNCGYCSKFMGPIRQLPKMIEGCHVGMVNVGEQSGIVTKSAQSIAPLQYVPYIVLYVNGVPFMAYESVADAESLRQFILDTAEQVRNDMMYVDTQKNHTKRQRKIPSYSLGMPLKGDNDKVCYLTMEDYNP